MMPVLVDSNILLRMADRSSSQHAICVAAIRELARRGHELAICAQVVIEFWSVATRPLNVNGLGLSAAEADTQLDDLLDLLLVLPEPADMARRWRDFGRRYSVIGKTSHDARLAALANAHGVSDILTINVGDFRRFAELDVISPADVVGP